MRVTVCELPHERRALATAWAELCEHAWRHASELVLLPELAMVEPVWESDRFESARWAVAQSRSESCLLRLPELHAACVIGTRAVSAGGRRLNQGYVWSQGGCLTPLRSKLFLPAEPGAWEARWFDRGTSDFPVFHAGELSFGLNICTELWALQTYAAYAANRVHAIVCPRATAAATTDKWVALGVTAAVRSGAFSLSSNRVDPSGACGGVGWIISPEGQILARTTPDAPFATVEIDLGAAAAAHESYPRYVFAG